MKVWKEKPLKGYSKNIYLIYTGVFFITLLLTFIWHIAAGKAIVWMHDGLTQHYNTLAYYGEYLREIVERLFTEGKFQIPLWDFKIGFGSDVISTLNYYGIGDPLNLLSVFVPASKAEYLYEILIFVKMYLAGLGFIAYCKTMKREGMAAVTGAVVYVFCGYFFHAGPRHPFFLNPMIYLPFLMIGVEKIFQKKKPYVFIAMVALSAMSNFYFFYMLSVLILLYAVFRFFFIYKERKVYHFFICLRNFSGFYVIGVLIGAVFLLPNIWLLLNGGRFSIPSSVPLLYNPGYYGNLIFSFISGNFPGNWTGISFSPIAMAAILLLFFKRKKHLDLKISFLILGGFLLVPYAAHVMNGFSYVANRWSFAFSFMVSFILAVMLPDLLNLTKREGIFLGGATIAYLLLSIPARKSSEFFLPAWLILAVTVMLLCLYSKMKERIRIPKSVVYAALMVSVISGISWQAYVKFNTEAGGNLDTYVDAGTAYSRMADTGPGLVKEVGDTGFYRYDLYGKSYDVTMQNAGMMSGVNGSDFYFSLADAPTGEFLNDLAVLRSLSYKYKGLDNRASLDTLANVKYQTMGSEDTNRLYGYKKLKTSGKTGLTVYENLFALPFGYTYGSLIPSAEYKKLNPVEKQEAMLQGAVLETEEKQMPAADVTLTGQEVKSKIKAGKDASFKENTFTAKKKGTAEITFEGKPNCETYLLFDGLYYSPGKGGDKNKGEITAVAKDSHKVLKIFTPKYRSYEKKKQFAVNLGYSEEPLNSASLYFSQKGDYVFENLRVICQPMSSFEGQVNKLKEDVLENPVFEPNKITGTISLDQKKLLCLTIPYSTGWSAYVDGQKAELQKTNVMYSGLILESGDHTIELRYFTPCMKVALLCLAAGVLALAGVVVYGRRKKKQG